jgi:hypothetical protein
MARTGRIPDRVDGQDTGQTGAANLDHPVNPQQKSPAQLGTGLLFAIATMGVRVVPARTGRIPDRVDGQDTGQARAANLDHPVNPQQKSPAQLGTGLLFAIATMGVRVVPSAMNGASFFDRYDGCPGSSSGFNKDHLPPETSSKMVRFAQRE